MTRKPPAPKTVRTLPVDSLTAVVLEKWLESVVGVCRDWTGSALAVLCGLASDRNIVECGWRETGRGGSKLLKGVV